MPEASESCLLDNPTLEHMKIPTEITISSKAIYFPRLKNRPERIVLRQTRECTQRKEGSGVKRDPNAPKVSKALYVRFGRQFLDEDTPGEFLLGSHPELDSNRINIVRRVFRRAQRIARSKNRRSVIDSDVLLAMPPQT
ncbi:hypothetical protein AVEN_275549-1 [Araneus ventricosus]|uniref:Uncharacterized protein n=1 Tax=Araneus ventricosus TaxID=182803 RepID=A0A4Y2VT99_ARAVE|nr:hypothetical protein AVEN_275549-1 [Araneus ventricosus]